MTDYQSTDYQSKSWWLESLPETILPNPPLTGAHKADVVVVGGGYTGLSVGYHLRELNPGIDVRVIESDVCGYGASGRNGGFSMTLFGLTKGITQFRFNDEKARAAHTYMESAVDYLHEVITQNRIDCDYERSGYLLVGTSPAQVKRVEHDFKIIERWGSAGIERWDRARLAEEFHTDFYKLGWFEPRCGIIQPAKLARGMKGLAEARGVTIYENSPVTHFSKNGSSGYTVKTEKGEVQSEYLVFATNAYSILFPQLKSLQRPIFTYIVMSEPLSDARMESIGWQCRAGVEDARDLIHYYRLTKDNRIVMGGGDVAFTYGNDLTIDLNNRIFAHLEGHVTEVFPQLKGIRFTHRWGGPVSVTVDMAPVIGYLGEDKKTIFSLGCIGHGVSLTTYNGRTIAEMIAGQRSSRTEMFFVGRKTIPWPPDPITYGAAHAIRGFMRLEDRLYYK
ncbi:MAG: oxidoreductase [Desulfobacterales bacterium CG23_combo_of_CG06-09_8_20_14_all_51_8]|nr:MAG: oxidoreductase [Desulfobacterales bacterium CG23_combo_of_CG06-09_8_20_14_all_51_8]